MTCNHRGQRLLELCVDNNLVDTHSWTPQRNKATWKHPRFKTEHLIDHFFVARAHGRNVQRTLTLNTELIQEYQLHDWTEYTDHKPIELRIKLAPPLSYKRQHEHAPRLATHKGRGNTQEARELRAQYHDCLQAMLDHCEENLSWEDIRRLTTEAATQVFGCTTRPHPRPWLTGHEAEIKEWSDNISGIKRRFENAKDLCDSNHHTEEDVGTRDRLARELRTAKRQKVNTLKRWEQHYWHNVGREAEIAERGQLCTLQNHEQAQTQRDN